MSKNPVLTLRGAFFSLWAVEGIIGCISYPVVTEWTLGKGWQTRLRNIEDYGSLEV
jgi:hypothetical protein